LPLPPDEKQHDDSEMYCRGVSRDNQVVAVRPGERDGTRCQEGKFGEGFAGKNSSQDERQDAQDEQPKGDETERAAFEAQAAIF
jgi:hypothetical protein